MKNQVKLLGIIAAAAVIGISMTACPTDTSEALDTTVTGVTVSPSTAEVARGGTQPFTATVAGTNGPPQEVTWAIDGTVHAGTTISPAGLLTVATSETLTTLTIRATSTFNSSVSGTATVTVLIPTVDSVTVNPSTAEVARGGTQSFTATVAGTNNPTQEVTWTIDGTVHTGTTISPAGLLTVAAEETLASFTVRAISTFDTSVSGTAAVTVLIPTVTGVTVSPSTTEIRRGETLSFTATVAGTNGPPQEVTWTIDGTVQTGTTISPVGLLTVATSETLTTLTVRATSTFNSSVSGTATVTVLIPTVDSVTVSPLTAEIRRGETQIFTAAVAGTNTPTQEVTWTIDGTVHTGTTISPAGLLTIAAAETLANFTVRATSTFDTSVSGTAAVTVLIPTVTGVTVNPSTAEIRRGETQPFTATVAGTNNPTQEVTWTIDGTVHTGTTISPAGLLTIAAAETLANFTVRATSTFDTSVSGTAAVTVLIPTVTGVTVNPSTAEIRRGETQPFTATVAGTNNPTQEVTWTIDGAVHTGTTISPAGLLTVAAAETLANFTVRATSTFDTSVSGTAAITVLVGTGDFTISFAYFVDLDPEYEISGPTVNLLGPQVNITITDPELYSSIGWFRGDGTQITGNAVSENGAILTLNSSVHNNHTGTHRITVVVIKNGVPHSRTIAFAVEL